MNNLEIFDLLKDTKFENCSILNVSTIDNSGIPELKKTFLDSINQFSKKQMTFFRRMEKRGLNIHWVNPESNDVYALVTSFLAP